MNIDPQTLQIIRTETGLEAKIQGQNHLIERLARAFPRTNPDRYVSLMDSEGHEIGIIENPEQLDAESREIVEAELKEIYFKPTVESILSVTTKGTGSLWEVETDDGPRQFKIIGREALSGASAPSIEIHDDNGKRYKIEDYWKLDAESRNLIADLLPDKILKARYARSNHGHGGGRR
ncbi:MAG: DUF1854 domain-containing protein [bacterium]|nr:DUF1854 domain-containing protein [bacterium]